MIIEENIKTEPLAKVAEILKKSENLNLTDWNAMNIATVSAKNIPSSRMVLLKKINDDGLVFYTNFNSKKGNDLKINKKSSMCFHWKSIRRQVRIIGTVEKVTDKEADDYYNSRPYKNKIGAWASSQSEILNKRDDFIKKIETYEKKYPSNDVPRPTHWSGWRLLPSQIEFWLDGEGRIHERLNYKKEKGSWKKELLYP